MRAVRKVEWWLYKHTLYSTIRSWFPHNKWCCCSPHSECSQLGGCSSSCNCLKGKD